MKLCGEIVNHQVFGKGKITSFTSNRVTIFFLESKAEKAFVYPSAFRTFLKLENKLFLSQIEAEIEALAQEEAENKRIKKEIAQLAVANSKESGAKRTKTTVAKATDKNNIAFKCNYCDGGKSKDIVGYKGVCSDETIKYNINVAKHIWCSQPENKCYKYMHGEVSRKEVCEFFEQTKSEFSASVCYESQMLEIWNAGAGITQSGAKKGQPMSLRNAKANSLALLTTKLPYADDRDRFIFAVFLIDENYQGGKSEEGYVGANPNYRIQLSLEEASKLKFWDYYYNPNKPERVVFGSGLHRYITDDQAAQVLREICVIKKGTSEEELSKEFLEHYCLIKGLDIEQIPLPAGALQRATG